jgi:sialate O-acetylesterase
LLGLSQATCYYYGQSLTDALAKATDRATVTPIGLIHTAWGGSTIEQWLTNETIATCADVRPNKANQEWHDSRVLPYTEMSLKGWVWYQVSSVNSHTCV